MFIPGINAFAAGFISGMIASGGDLRAGIIGAITAGAFHGIGSYYQGLSTKVVETGYAFGEAFHKTVNVGLSFGQQVAKTIAHGVVGGLSQVASGGKFVAGFLSAGTSQAFALSGGYAAVGASDAPSSFGGYVYNAAVAGTVGGAVSVLGGDKFKNGAITGAFSRMFNDMSHLINKIGALTFHGASFAISMTEATIGVGTMMVTAAGPGTQVLIPPGFTLATHGVLGMANSARAFVAELYDLPPPAGVLEVFGDSIAGRHGAIAGRVYDSVTSFSGATNGMLRFSSTLSTGATLSTSVSIIESAKTMKGTNNERY